jgi:hypothetical protein
MIEIVENIENVNITVDEITETVNITVSEEKTIINIEVSEIGLQGIQGEQGEAGGILIKLAGENINSHTPVALLNNLAYKLDASNPLHQFAFVGFAETSTIVGGQCTIKQIGEVILLGWGLIPNQQYLAGINGTLITENLSSSNFTKVIGYATTADTLQIIKDSITINKI